MECRVEKPMAKIGPDRNGFVRRKEREEWDLKEVHEQLIKDRVLLLHSCIHAILHISAELRIAIFAQIWSIIYYNMHIIL